MASGSGQPNESLELKAIMGQVVRMSLVVESIANRMEKLEASSALQGSKSVGKKHENPVYEKDELDDEDFDEMYASDASYSSKKCKKRTDDSLRSIKLEIPKFASKSDPDAYLDWESKVEAIFDVHDYSEGRKIKLAVVEFSGHARNWWNQLKLTRRRNHERPIKTWEEMKAAMRKRYLPTHYFRALFQRLQKITQGSRSVDEYFKEMENIMIQLNIEEDPKATMAQFLGGLNREIAHLVNVHHYVELDEMVQMAEKVEKNLKEEKGSTNRSSTRHLCLTRRGVRILRLMRAQSLKVMKLRVRLGRGHIASQCPNSRVMTMLDDGSYLSSSDKEEEEGMAKFMEGDDVEEIHPEPYEVTCTAVVLHSQVEVDGVDPQRTNIF